MQTVGRGVRTLPRASGKTSLHEARTRVLGQNQALYPEGYERELSLAAKYVHDDQSSYALVYVAVFGRKEHIEGWRG